MNTFGPTKIDDVKKFEDDLENQNQELKDNFNKINNIIKNSPENINTIQQNVKNELKLYFENNKDDAKTMYKNIMTTLSKEVQNIGTNNTSWYGMSFNSEFKTKLDTNDWKSLNELKNMIDKINVQTIIGSLKIGEIDTKNIRPETSLFYDKEAKKIVLKYYDQDTGKSWDIDNTLTKDKIILEWFNYMSNDANKNKLIKIRDNNTTVEVKTIGRIKKKIIFINYESDNKLTSNSWSDLGSKSKSILKFNKWNNSKIDEIINELKLSTYSKKVQKLATLLQGWKFKKFQQEVYGDKTSELSNPIDGKIWDETHKMVKDYLKPPMTNSNTINNSNSVTEADNSTVDQPKTSLNNLSISDNINLWYWVLKSELKTVVSKIKVTDHNKDRVSNIINGLNNGNAKLFQKWVYNEPWNPPIDWKIGWLTYNKLLSEFDIKINPRQTRIKRSRENSTKGQVSDFNDWAKKIKYIDFRKLFVRAEWNFDYQNLKNQNTAIWKIVELYKQTSNNDYDNKLFKKSLKDIQKQLGAKSFDDMKIIIKWLKDNVNTQT